MYTKSGFRIVAKPLSVMSLVAVLTLLLTVVQAAPLHGAIFTTTPDGGIVNENVRYQSKIEVYLDGGPPVNAPQTAAGLPDGIYVFQVTDPPGKVLLSEDPAKCRVVEVESGVIIGLVNPGDALTPSGDPNPLAGLSFTYTDQNGDTQPCNIQDPPHPPDPAGPDDAGSSGRHDTNVDVDHGADGAVVVQLMPFFDTPNPGGVYKAWIIPLDRYDANDGDLEAVPERVCGRRGRIVKKCTGNAVQIGYVSDPGFGPPRDQVKTDNFKVREFFPPEITVRKFHDINSNGVWDEGEPEIGVDQCIDETGNIIECGEGGWPYDFTWPADNGPMTQGFYAPYTHVAGVPGTYIAEEEVLSGWTQTAAFLDGVPQSPLNPVNVEVMGASGETHVVIFGNFQNVEVTACKYEDYDGDGGADAPIAGWEVSLTENDQVIDTQETLADGCYTWTDLGPVPGGKYDVHEEQRAGWTPTSATSHDFTPITSGGSYSFTFTNFQNVEVTACKEGDADGDLATTDDQHEIEGWTVHRSEDGVVVDTQLTGPDGCYTWENLGPRPEGYYDVSEEVPSGWGALTLAWHDFESPPQSDASYTFTFVNFGPCDGLTPGYWVNWRNHYKQNEFVKLLEGTIADVDGLTPNEKVALADEYLTSLGCDDGDALHCMRRFLLANQLTLNLTASTDQKLFRPAGVALIGACSIEGYGTLQEAIDDGLAILANPGDFTRDQILEVKNRLASFAELNP